ncbi:putative Alkaline phosphatase [Streptomyces misionensis JCM 4497]
MVPLRLPPARHRPAHLPRLQRRRLGGRRLRQRPPGGPGRGRDRRVHPARAGRHRAGPGRPQHGRLPDPAQPTEQGPDHGVARLAPAAAGPEHGHRPGRPGAPGRPGGAARRARGHQAGRAVPGHRRPDGPGEGAQRHRFPGHRGGRRPGRRNASAHDRTARRARDEDRRLLPRRRPRAAPDRAEGVVAGRDGRAAAVLPRPHRAGVRHAVGHRARDLRHPRRPGAAERRRGPPVPDQRAPPAGQGRRLVTGRVPALGPPLRRGPAAVRRRPRPQHPAPGRAPGAGRVLRAGGPVRRADPARLGVLRQVGGPGQRHGEWGAVDPGRLSGGAGVDGRRGRPAPGPPERAVLPDRQRLRARRQDRAELPGRPARRRLEPPGNPRRLRQVLAAARPFGHEDDRPLRLGAARLLVRQARGRRHRLQLRDQRGPERPDPGHPAPDAHPGRTRHPLEGPEGEAVPPLALRHLRHAGAVRRRPRRPLRLPHRPRRLRPQGATGAVRERACPVRGVRTQRDRPRGARDRGRALDVQQRLDVPALAADRPLPRPGRRLLRREEGQRAAAHPVFLRRPVGGGGEQPARGRPRAHRAGHALRPGRHPALRRHGRRCVGGRRRRPRHRADPPAVGARPGPDVSAAAGADRRGRPGGEPERVLAVHPARRPRLGPHHLVVHPDERLRRPHRPGLDGAGPGGGDGPHPVRGRCVDHDRDAAEHHGRRDPLAADGRAPGGRAWGARAAGALVGQRGWTVAGRVGDADRRLPHGRPARRGTPGAGLRLEHPGADRARGMTRGVGPAGPTPPARSPGQATLSAVSSRTNEVWYLEPSVPVNFRVTVCPA